MSMAKREAKTVVPRLRFPEFVEADGWPVSLLGHSATFEKGRGVSKAEIDPKGKRYCIRYGELYTQYGEVISKVLSKTSADESTLFLSRRNDVIVPASGETKDDIATASCVMLDGIALGGDLNVIRSPHNGIFLSYLLNGSRRRELAKVAQGDTVVHLYPRHLAVLSVAIPEATEQQKIADCLTSLDEVIAAQGRKVEALKAHKRGLMQQLFPREGETRPRLRFPEFRDGQEWIARPLGELMVIGSSRRVHESDWTTTGVPFYRAREIVALAKGEPITPLFISETLYREFSGYTGEIEGGQLLVTGVGSIGIPYLVKSGDRFYFKDGNIIWLKNDQAELTGNFLLRLFESEYVQGQIATMAGIGTVGTYTIDNARRTIVVFPTDKREQRRVANCLSFLDAQIAAESRQLAALKTHKQGLMQQLFPAPEAA